MYVGNVIPVLQVVQVFVTLLCCSLTILLHKIFYKFDIYLNQSEYFKITLGRPARTLHQNSRKEVVASDVGIAATGCS